jgi:four helix bundle protein
VGSALIKLSVAGSQLSGKVMKTKSYKDLKVWQKSIELTVLVYDLTKTFPKEEMYGLTSQIRRAAVSVPSNIAEGCERFSMRDYIRFLRTSKGSLAELETQLYIAVRLNYLTTESYFRFNQQASEIGRMLNGLISSLEDKLETDNMAAIELTTDN